MWSLDDPASCPYADPYVSFQVSARLMRHPCTVLQEKDDVRKRRRHERLHQLRTGSCKDWVALAR